MSGDRSQRWYYHKPAAEIGFARLLRDERQRKGLKQTELADLVGVHQSKISAYERGDILHPNPQTLIKLAEVLGLPESTFTDLAGWQSARELLAMVPPDGALVVPHPTPQLVELIDRVADMTDQELAALQESANFIMAARPSIGDDGTHQDEVTEKRQASTA